LEAGPAPRPSPPVPKESGDLIRNRKHPHYSTPAAGRELEGVATTATSVTARAEGNG